MTAMDEHEQRAREVQAEIVTYIASQWTGGGGTPDFSHILAAFSRAAVAAERERHEAAVDAAQTVCDGARVEEFYDGIQAPWRPTVIDDRDVVALREALRALRSAPTPAPAQAEQRVSEGRYDPSNPAHYLGATVYDAVIDALAKHDSEGMPHKWDKVAAQAVEQAVRKEAVAMLTASQHRIAARLRARADEEEGRARGEAKRKAHSLAEAHLRTASVLRSEADALEEGGGR